MELSAVLVIAGIVALLAIPRMGRSQSASEARQFAASIAKVLDLARVRALSTRRTYTLTTSPTEVRLTYVDDAGTTQTEERVRSSETVRIWAVSNVLLDSPPSTPETPPHAIRVTASSMVDLDGGAGVNAYLYVAPVNATGAGGRGDGGRYLVSVIATGIVQLVDSW
jgi:type II secretory pathway pseudopilin PulG